MDDLTGLTNIESERVVLASIFLEPELIRDCSLVPEQFGMARHVNLFRLLKQMDEKQIPIEVQAVCEEAGPNLDDIGGISYIADIIAGYGTTTSFGYYVGLIAEYHTRRKIYEVGQAMMQDALSSEVGDVMQNAREQLSKLEENEDDNDDGDGHIKKVLIDTYAWMETDHGDIAGASTGFRDLDELTGGLKRQNLIIIGGRPSMGKTAIAMNLVANHSMSSEDGENPSAVFSLEMDNLMLTLRMISSVGNIDGRRIQNPIKNFVDEDWVRTTGAFGQLSQLPIHLFDKAGVTIPYIRQKLRLLKRKYPTQHIVVMIDYLQLVQGDVAHKGNRTQEISEISRQLKQIARDLDLTVVALSQLSRKVEERADKRPMLSDLRESGQIEQDADVIAFVYRDEYYDKDSDRQGITELILAKQRNGPIGVVELAFAKEYSKFINIG